MFLLCTWLNDWLAEMVALIVCLQPPSTKRLTIAICMIYWGIFVVFVLMTKTLKVSFLDSLMQPITLDEITILRKISSYMRFSFTRSVYSFIGEQPMVKLSLHPLKRIYFSIQPIRTCSKSVYPRSKIEEHINSATGQNFRSNSFSKFPFT